LPETVALLVFSVVDQCYAMHLAAVDRVIRAVELSALPQAPRVVRGVFSLHGQLLPVADLRRRIEAPDREIELDDWIIIAHTPSRMIGVLAEGGARIEECAVEHMVASEMVLGADDAFEGIARLSSGLVLIQNLGRFLSIEEEQALEGALDANR
jgi:purine-binding chemotaxis protein CheW